MQFTPRQTIAISYPCLTGLSAIHHRYAERKGRWASLLTVNK